MEKSGVKVPSRNVGKQGDESTMNKTQLIANVNLATANQGNFDDGSLQQIDNDTQEHILSEKVQQSTNIDDQSPLNQKMMPKGADGGFESLAKETENQNNLIYLE
jgi:hypothetical protein